VLQVSVLGSDIVKAGLQALVHVAGSVVTANPLGLIQVGGRGAGRERECKGWLQATAVF
jgi:hypothetical protein